MCLSLTPVVYSVDFSVGTEDGEEDVFPDEVVAYNESSSVTLSADGLYIGGLANGSMSDVNPSEEGDGNGQRSERGGQTQFHMEPGRFASCKNTFSNTQLAWRLQFMKAIATTSFAGHYT